MKEFVMKLGCSWQYDQDPNEIEIQCSSEIVEFDDVAYIPITDRAKMQVCVIRKGDKYGVYTLDNSGMGGPGVWCSPTVNPFPYDEVKFCTFPFDYPNDHGVFAFRIGEKWGIIKVVDGDNKEEGVYDVEYRLSKRRIVVPCVYATLEDAESQLGNSYDWEDPFNRS